MGEVEKQASYPQSHSLERRVCVCVCLCVCVRARVLGLPCCTWAFSSCGEQGRHSACGVRAPHCGGSSCGGLQALESQVQ